MKVLRAPRRSARKPKPILPAMPLTASIPSAREATVRLAPSLVRWTTTWGRMVA